MRIYELCMEAVVLADEADDGVAWGC